MLAVVSLTSKMPVSVAAVFTSDSCSFKLDTAHTCAHISSFTKLNKMPCCLLLQAASKLIDLEHSLWANQLVHTPHVKCIKKSVD